MSNLLTISYGDTQEGAVALEAALKHMADNGAMLEIETVQLGAEMTKLGYARGFDEEALSKIRRSRVLLKAPTEEDVTTALRAELGDEAAIFQPTDNTREAALEASVQMLRHIGQFEVAALIEE